MQRTLEPLDVISIRHSRQQYAIAREQTAVPSQHLSRLGQSMERVRVNDAVEVPIRIKQIGTLERADEDLI